MSNPYLQSLKGMRLKYGSNSQGNSGKQKMGGSPPPAKTKKVVNFSDTPKITAPSGQSTEKSQVKGAGGPSKLNREKASYASQGKKRMRKGVSFSRTKDKWGGAKSKHDMSRPQ